MKVAVGIVLSLGALMSMRADAQVRIPRDATPQQPAQGPLANQRQTQGPTYGVVSPGISVDDVLIRRPNPILTLSDSQINKDGFLRLHEGDLRLGFVVAGGSVRGIDLSRYSDQLMLRGDGRLSLVGGPVWTSNGWKGSMELDNGAALAWKQNASGQSFGIGHTNGGLYFFRTNAVTTANNAPAQYDMTIKDDGTVSIRVLELEGADVAESFPIDEVLEPGTVVSIDPDRPGNLKMSDRAFDHRVAGIVSGAGGINPGVVMAKGAKPGSHAIALTGRVYCLADTTAGPIVPGDLLTTSSTPGHAMKVTDHSAAQGAIIGKAMSGLREGRGLVLVLVTLQ